MAQRRMVSKKIIDTDIFLDMPVSARELYFQLLLRADDEGFIGNVKRIIRMIGSANDDLKVLIARGFIIPFNTGIVVVSHWRIHNYIQSDRFQPTQHTAEREELEISNNIYIKKGECIQNVSKMDTQVRLGKDSIDKISNTNKGDFSSKNSPKDLTKSKRGKNLDRVPNTDKVSKEGSPLKAKPLTPLQKVVNHYLGLVGNINNKEWVKAVFKKHARAGKSLLAICGGDINKAIKIIDKGKDYFARKGLDWTLATVVSHFPKIERRKKYVF